MFINFNILYNEAHFITETVLNLANSTYSNTYESLLVPLCIAVAGFTTSCIGITVCLIHGIRTALQKPEQEEHDRDQLQVMTSCLGH